LRRLSHNPRFVSTEPGEKFTVEQCGQVVARMQPTLEMVTVPADFRTPREYAAPTLTLRIFASNVILI